MSLLDEKIKELIDSNDTVLHYIGNSINELKDKFIKEGKTEDEILKSLNEIINDNKTS